MIIFLLLVLGTFLFYFKNLWPDKLNQVQNQIRESDSLNTIESDIQNSEQYLNNSDQDLENDFGEVITDKNEKRYFADILRRRCKR